MFIITKTRTRTLRYTKVDSTYFFVQDITYDKNTSNGYYSKIAQTKLKGKPCHT